MKRLLLREYFLILFVKDLSVMGLYMLVSIFKCYIINEVWDFVNSMIDFGVIMYILILLFVVLIFIYLKLIWR